MKNILVLMAMMLVLTACNTMEGLGKDIQEAGKSIEDNSKGNKDY